jgi:putative flippase GtrA
MKLSLRRALKFWTVGALGAVIQSVVFYALTRYAGVPDFIEVGKVLEVPWALGWAIVLAAISNYFFNELWTWREPAVPKSGAGANVPPSTVPS